MSRTSGRRNSIIFYEQVRFSLGEAPSYEKQLRPGNSLQRKEAAEHRIK